MNNLLITPIRIILPCMMITTAWGQEGKAPQTDPENMTVLQPLMVTGELIDRPLSASGTSTEVFTSDTLKERAGLSTLRDVLDSVPNLSLVTGTGKAPTIRGVDGTGPAENANAFFAGSRPRLSWQIDGRPASYNEVVFGDLGLYDIEQIEVLRGPQSTLVGRNAIAGSVIVKTHDPKFKEEGSVKVQAGNNSQRQLSGMVNSELIEDTLAVRLTIDSLQKESSVHYDSFDGVSNPGEIEGQTIRGKLLFTPDKDYDPRLLLSLTQTSYKGPNGEIIVEPFDERRSNFPQQPVHKPESTSFAADYSMSLNTNWQLQLNASTSDFDFTRHSAPNSSNATIRTKEYVVEPQLRYQNQGTNLVTGMYYYQARQKESIEFFGGQNFDDKTDTVAVYSEGLIPLSESVDLSLGLRYEQEDRQRHGGNPNSTPAVAISSNESYQEWLPKIGINWSASENINWGAQLSKGYNAGGGGITFASPIVNYEYDKETVVTYEVYGRQQFANGQISTTQNLFHSRYKDMQLPFDLTPNDTTDESFVVRNADKVDTWGLELGVNAELTNEFNLWANLALLETDIVAYPNSGVEGNQLLSAPNFTASIGVLWQQENWQASLSSRYSNSYYTDVNNRAGGKTDPYVVTDASVSYEMDTIRLFSSVKNLFDTNKPVARYPGALPSAVLLQPRTYLVGAEIKY
ncbi:TonB-dependent receptor [Marinomonas algicola]|uniref:TonB-dependent receptor n=1 Tax=Marinomonas algicola TaxID=2773454 RepID=UPI001748809D|nr:TonB-dependent receptor [Marinomonas algicola]